MTPLEEFKRLVPNVDELSNEQLIVFRDLIDAQANLILDSYLATKMCDIDPNSTKEKSV